MKWILPEQNTDNIIEWLFQTRNIKDREKFFNPTINDLYDPFLLYGVDDAVKAISEAVKNQKKIYIHGDFDVDGMTSTSILWNFLYRDLNAHSTLPFIPNRFTDGYGLSEDNIKRIVDEGGELIITVDCGIKDIELINRYSDIVDFVITDHHTIRKSEDNIEGSKKVGDFLISAKAKGVIHPQLNPDYPFKEICGAFVAWKLCQALNEYMKTGVDMTKYLDLVALGTVCDVMPLIDENRCVVKLGIEQFKNTQNIGLKKLIKISGIDQKQIDTYHLGFILGPRLNASGRLETAMDGVRLLTTQSDNYAEQIARKLDELNRSRQDLTRKYLEIAEERIQSELDKQKIHFIYGEEWPEGIVGLVAGRLTEKYNRPVLIGSLKDGVIKASARSIPEFHIANTLKELNKYLIAHGGHAQAAGLTLSYDSFESFYNDLSRVALEQIEDSFLEKSLVIDAVGNINSLDLNLAEDILRFAPFGSHNAKPVIALLSLKIQSGVKLMGKDNNHLKFCVGSGDGNIDCIAFNFTDKFKDIVGDNHAALVDVAGTLDIDVWNGYRKPVFKVEDIRLSE